MPSRDAERHLPPDDRGRCAQSSAFSPRIQKEIRLAASREDCVAACNGGARVSGMATATQSGATIFTCEKRHVVCRKRITAKSFACRRRVSGEAPVLAPALNHSNEENYAKRKTSSRREQEGAAPIRTHQKIRPTLRP